MNSGSASAVGLPGLLLLVLFVAVIVFIVYLIISRVRKSSGGVQKEISNLRKDIQVLQDKMDTNNGHTGDRNEEQEKVYSSK
ncbi:hypothetical protein ASD24_06495 [Paenibacillus sp. Root52]|uniref:hypothetical protein n=1 Tax=Paenibacillus sp. Root52 TaxID=1736552 RepID=UPI0006F41D6B|nr:hypothetical protein [Paenibacillus sp. Root52]KQY87498.1 hypothetical protein ASD24_06495 [Paenibacillus sp. Root52]